MEAVRRKFNHTVPNGTASCSIQLDCSDWVAVAPRYEGLPPLPDPGDTI